jgi:diguanylate cyclase (GGDEF)-like protein
MAGGAFARGVTLLLDDCRSSFVRTNRPNRDHRFCCDSQLGTHSGTEIVNLFLEYIFADLRPGKTLFSTSHATCEAIFRRPRATKSLSGGHMLVRRRKAPVHELAGNESLRGARHDGSPTTPTGQEIEHLRGVVAQLIHAAAHDALTGLPTRGLLLERLEHELARDAADGARVAVLFVDLDNFKLVNDSLGHGSGDEVLSEMARRIVGCIGSEDTASRFGGDEMVVLHPRATDDSGTTLGKRILAALAEPLVLSGKEVVVTASAGVALCKPGMKSAEQLLREADTALYAAKDRGRARLEQFNDELHARAEKRVQIESDLRAALRQSQLFVEYQPQVRLKDGSVVGVEALIRWRHPSQGVIPPGDFIPVAEDCGLIVNIGQRVLQESCRQLAEWMKLAPGRPLAMTVNVSPLQLAEPAFFAELRQVLADSGINPTALCLEITENAMMSATEEVARQFDQIRQLGVYIAIRRFRHRPLVAVSPPRHAGRGAEDRPQLHRRPQ